MKKLTVKQELFITELLTGVTKTEAYKRAFKSKSSDKVCRNKASELFNQAHIKKRYTELLTERQNNVEYSNLNAYENLMLIIDYAKDDLKKRGINKVNSDAIIKATEQLNRLLLVDKSELERLHLEVRKIDLQESKLVKDNEKLESEKADLLLQLVNNV